MGLRRFFKFVLLVLFMGYVGFIATGPYPVILWGFKLDHLFAFGTAMVSFVSALVWGLLYAGWKSRRRFVLQVLKKTTIVAFIVVFGFISLNKMAPTIVASYTDRFARIFEGDLEINETWRIMAAKNTLELWSDNLKKFVLGNGFFATNPHNEFLRMLGGSGFLGFILFSFMFVTFYMTCCRSRTAPIAYLVTQNALFAYILIMIQFYGHTKSLWVGFTFLLMNYMAQKRRQGKIQIRRAQQMRVAKGEIPIA